MLKRWFHVQSRNGEMLARCTYAHHAVALAMITGAGSTVVFRGEIVYTTPPGTRYSMELACAVGDDLRRAAYSKGGKR